MCVGVWVGVGVGVSVGVCGACIHVYMCAYTKSIKNYVNYICVRRLETIVIYARSRVLSHALQGVPILAHYLVIKVCTLYMYCTYVCVSTSGTYIHTYLLCKW